MKQRLVVAFIMLMVLGSIGINTVQGQSPREVNDKQPNKKRVWVDPGGFISLPEGYKAFRISGFIDAWFGYVESADGKLKINFSAGTVESFFDKYKNNFVWTKTEQNLKLPIIFGLMRIKKKRYLWHELDGLSFQVQLHKKAIRIFLWKLSTLIEEKLVRNAADFHTRHNLKINEQKEVSEFLGVSTRLVEKYASEGRLGEVTYIRGKTGKQAEYNREAVEKLKNALESPDTALAATSPDARLFVAQLVEAITTREQANIEAIRGLLSGSGEEPRSASVRVSEKILLNLSDCRLLTGLSESNLRDAIKSGKLRAKIIGRGWKVKRQDLDEFIKKL